jgi:guanylate kinase
LSGRGYRQRRDVIARRLAAARDEMRHVDEFDYVIINDDLQQALDDLRAVVRASRLRYETQRQRHPRCSRNDLIFRKKPWHE